jgi:regulatory protein
MDFKAAIFRYCDYQERCQYEVRTKLIELGCRGAEIEELIATLIENNLLNEERYACAIARGKFRLKQWGRVKIVNNLKAHQISDYCIQKALKEIDEEDYEKTLQRLATKKWNELKGEKNQFIKRKKLQNYLQQKGFESAIIFDFIQKQLTVK